MNENIIYEIKSDKDDSILSIVSGPLNDKMMHPSAVFCI